MVVKVLGRVDLEGFVREGVLNEFGDWCWLKVSPAFLVLFADEDSDSGVGSGVDLNIRGVCGRVESVLVELD